MSVTHGQCDARPMVTFPAARHHRPLAGTKSYYLVTEAHVHVLTTCPGLHSTAAWLGNWLHIQIHNFFNDIRFDHTGTATVNVAPIAGSWITRCCGGWKSASWSVCRRPTQDASCSCIICLQSSLPPTVTVLSSLQTSTTALLPR